MSDVRNGCRILVMYEMVVEWATFHNASSVWGDTVTGHPSSCGCLTVFGQDYVPVLSIHGALHGTSSVCSKTFLVFQCKDYSAFIFIDIYCVHQRGWMCWVILHDAVLVCFCFPPLNLVLCKSSWLCLFILFVVDPVFLYSTACCGVLNDPSINMSVPVKCSLSIFFSPCRPNF